MFGLGNTNLCDTQFERISSRIAAIELYDGAYTRHCYLYMRRAGIAIANVDNCIILAYGMESFSDGAHANRDN